MTTMKCTLCDAEISSPSTEEVLQWDRDHNVYCIGAGE